MPTKAELVENRGEVLKACLVHVYTALGLPLAFAALISAAQGDARGMFLFLVAALVIDGTDGPMARKFNVWKWTPRFDGRKLDDITDYLTYVFVPIFFMWRTDLVTGPWVGALMLALVASGYGFSNLAAKTEDKYFTGFPSYWNVVAFFMHLLNLPLWLNGLIVLVLAILVFVPIKFASTQAMTKLELMILPLLILGCLYIVLFNFDHPPQWLVYGLLIYPIYHVAHAVFVFLRGEKS
jgi:phosphatidylcholine synthase